MLQVRGTTLYAVHVPSPMKWITLAAIAAGFSGLLSLSHWIAHFRYFQLLLGSAAYMTLKRSSRCYHQGKGLLKGGSSLPTQSKDLTREKAEVKDRLPIKIPHCIVSSWISLLCSQ